MRRRRMLYALAVLGGAAGLHAPGLGAQEGAPRTLEFDFPAMRVGVAEDEAGPTGTTVFYFPGGVTAAASPRRRTCGVGLRAR